MQGSLNSIVRAALLITLIHLAPGGTGTAFAQNKLRGWSTQAAVQWWQNHPTPDSWHEAATDLKAALLAAQEEHGIAVAFTNRHFAAWLEHLRWISLHPKADGFLTSQKGARTFARIGMEAPQLVELFTASLSTYDNAPRAAEILCEIYAANPNVARDYYKLAIAFALVFDQPFPRSWPHPNTRRDLLAIGDESPAIRFQFYVNCAESKAFMLDPKRLSVRELICVVDTPLELRELQYVQQVQLKSPARLQDVYQAIPYRSNRLQDGELMWAHSTYRLIDIGRNGGVCADQAFYMTQCGKAKGIPTVIFIGQGQNGGHAWTGFMPKTGEWNMDVAKYRQERYPVGKAFDPQTWRKVTGEQLSELVKSQRGGSNAKRSARLVLQWAKMNRQHPSYAALLAYARKLAPRMLEAWEMEEARLNDAISSAEQWREFWRQWITAFRDQPDLEFRGQLKLLRVLRALGKSSDEDRLRKRIESDNRSSRFDLAISVAADSVLELMESGKPIEAQKAFDELINTFKSKGGGHLFYNLVVPYIDLALEKQYKKQAAQALWTVDSNLTFSENGTVSTDLKQLKDRVRSAG